MKIAYICNEYPPAPHGGIGTFVHSIAHGMTAAGHKVSVVAWGNEPGETDDSGVRIVTLPESKRRGMAWWINRQRICQWVRREAAAGNIDIVESPEFQGPLISRPGKTPVVLRLHLSASAIAHHARTQVRGLTGYCEKRSLALFRSWIPVSKFALELTRKTFGLEPRAARTVYYPIASSGESTPPVDGLPEGPFVLYAGGTVSRRKGAYVLAEAASRFLRTHPGLHLVYVGPHEHEDGVCADERIRNIVGAELTPRVVCCGRISRDTLLATMKRATAFIYPSTLETFGLVTAEAMLQACPVIVCNTGPCPEFVRHGRTGILVPPDSPEAIVKAVNQLLHDKEDADRMAKAGQRAVRSRFNLQRCVDETLEFYRDCLQERTAR